MLVTVFCVGGISSSGASAALGAPAAPAVFCIGVSADMRNEELEPQNRSFDPEPNPHEIDVLIQLVFGFQVLQEVSCMAYLPVQFLYFFVGFSSGQVGFLQFLDDTPDRANSIGKSLIKTTPGFLGPLSFSGKDRLKYSRTPVSLYLIWQVNSKNNDLNSG